VAEAEYEIHQSEKDDLNEGWIRVRSKGLEGKIKNRRPVCLVKDTATGKKVFVEALYADDNWLKNRRREHEQHLLLSQKNLIFLSAWYRHRLGLDELAPFTDRRLDIASDANFWRRIGWQLRACEQHPQIAVVMSTVLAVVGAGFGLVGIAAWLQSANWPIYFWALVALLGLIVILRAFLPLASRAQN
jgi:hypothetical protein